jgi:hypothetical protein
VQRIHVPREDQQITFQAPDGARVGGNDALTASSTSGLPVTFNSTTPDLCTVTGTTIHFDHASPDPTTDCEVQASQEGNADYRPATPVTHQVTIAKGTQTIDFTLTDAGQVGDRLPLTATGGPTDNPTAGTISYQTQGTGCQLQPNDDQTTTTLHLIHTTTCTVTATVAGTTDYEPATTAPHHVTITQGTQTIDFTTTAPPAPAFKGTYTVAAEGGKSGQDVVFSSTTTGVCSLSKATVTFLHAGDCVIHADQAGTDDYAPATQATQTITVPQVAQTITFTSTPPSPAQVGKSYDVSARGGGSGNAVTFGSDTPAVCTVSGSRVSFVSAGSCVVTADQAGNGDYLAARTTTQPISVALPGVDLSLELTPGAFHTVLVTVHGLPSGTSTTLTVSSDPRVTGLTWGEGCIQFGDLGSCKVTRDDQSFFFAVGSPPGGGPVTLTFTVAAPPGTTDTDPKDNTRSITFD